MCRRTSKLAQGMLEYGLIAAICAVVCVTVASNLGTQTVNTTNQLSNYMDNTMLDKAAIDPHLNSGNANPDEGKTVKDYDEEEVITNDDDDEVISNGDENVTPSDEDGNENSYTDDEEEVISNDENPVSTFWEGITNLVSGSGNDSTPTTTTTYSNKPTIEDRDIHAFVEDTPDTNSDISTFNRDEVSGVYAVNGPSGDSITTTGTNINMGGTTPPAP